MTKRRYEALLVLNTKGREESANDLIEAIEKQIKDAGADLEQTQRLEKRPFAYASRKQTGGYYVNFLLQATPGQIDALRGRWKLDPVVHLQHYGKLKPAAQAA